MADTLKINEVVTRSAAQMALLNGLMEGDHIVVVRGTELVARCDASVLAEALDAADTVNEVVEGVNLARDEAVAATADKADRAALEAVTAFVKAEDDGTFSVTDENGLAKLILDSLNQLVLAGGARIGADDTGGFSIADHNGRAQLIIDALNKLVLAGGARVATDERGGFSVAGGDDLAVVDYNPQDRRLRVSGRIGSTNRHQFAALAEIVFFPVYGQSWSMGFENFVEPLPQRYDSLMFLGGVRTQSFDVTDSTTTDNPGLYSSFIPLVERQDTSSPKYRPYSPNGLGQTLATGQTDMIKQLLESENNLTCNDIRCQFLSSAPGEGNTAIWELSKGSSVGAGLYSPYQRLIDQVQAGYDLCQAQGRSYDFPAFTWTQGNAGDVDVPGAPSYGERLELLRADLETDSAAIYPRRAPLKMITWQRYTDEGLTAAEVYDNFVKAAAEHEHICCACPSYFLPRMEVGAGGGGTHLSAIGSDLLGAYYGRAFKRWVEGAKPKPLEPIEFYRQGKILLVRFNNDSYPLSNDANSNAPMVGWLSNMGLQRRDAGGSETAITSVEIVGFDTIKIVCDSAWTSTSRLIGGETGNNGASDGSQYGPWTGNRLTLRDCAGIDDVYDPGFRNLPLHNWCVCFDKTTD